MAINQSIKHSKATVLLKTIAILIAIRIDIGMFRLHKRVSISMYICVHWGSFGGVKLEGLWPFFNPFKWCNYESTVYFFL